MFGELHQKRESKTSFAVLVFSGVFVLLFALGFCLFCIKRYTDVNGGDGINHKIERVGPQEIRSILVVFPLTLQVELDNVGSFKYDQALKQNV